MSEDKPGLRIRRKKDADADAAAAEGAEGAETAPDAEAAAPADAKAGDAKADAKPAGGSLSLADQRGAKAKAKGGPKARIWRAEPEARPAPAVEEAAPEEEEVDTGPPPTTEDFAAMLGEGPVIEEESYVIGDKVTAAVVAIGNEDVFVELGGKREGAIAGHELRDEDGALLVSPGDRVEAWIVAFDQGVIRLSTALGGSSADAEMLQDAADEGIPVEGRVVGVNKGGYEVELFGTRGFCPHSQIALDFVDEPETFIGQTLQFKITRVDDGGKNPVLSRAALLKEERARLAEDTLEGLAEDAVLDGTVRRLTDFGAFVDLGGVDGLLHVSEMSWGRVDDPSELYRVGDQVRVKVVRVDNLDDPEHRRIGLSVRSLEEDPWTTAVQKIQVGDTLNGTVQRLERFGAFVEIAPGVDGLVHVSEIDPGRRIRHPQDVLSPGDQVQVQIVKVDPQKRQIGLSMKALMDDPWSVAARELNVGAKIQGTVDSVQSFGVFVELASGINALIPMSQMEQDEARHAHTRFRPGTPIEARVLAVDPERRRLTLTRKEGTDEEAAANYAQYKSDKEEAAGLGTFADLLKKRK